ncbi:MAG: hypothetical protein ACREJ3_05075 [Polyangiaceae bacterium]
MTKPKTPKSAVKKPPTKTSYVLGFAHSTPAKEVVAKGKAAGITLTDKFVWAVRSDEKARKANGAKTNTAKSTARKTSNGVRLSAQSAEKALRAAAHVLGLARASEILDAEQREAQVLLGG